MPFGLTNSAGTFHHLVDVLFGPEFEPHIFSYLDDIIVTTETFEEHLPRVELVLNKILDARLTVNRKKYEFGCAQVECLGYLLD